MRPGAAFFFVLCSALPLTAQVTVAGKVADENNRAVAGARVELKLSGSAQSRAAISDVSGNFAMALEESGDYLLRAERQGFYLIQEKRIRIEDGVNHLAITLNHLQEFSESVDVTYSPPAIDLAEPSERRQLDNVEILTVPYPAPQDLRNSLPLFNGVVKDSEGQLHVDGGGTEQTNFTLDGFNVSDPVTGQFDARINIETVQSLDLQTSRYSASAGRGSAGSVDIRTKMGDDRWRFGGTNFHSRHLQPERAAREQVDPARGGVRPDRQGPGVVP
ncbi:MAG: carboxypeptidase-like regulatory domain-containing protein [Acidobacteria bacterium]|nr:carboxypeptidase-like regulatory domain-containing protein [Acidobacteriota bacterium]